MLHGDRTQLALTCSAGTASSHPEVRPGANSVDKEESTHSHVRSFLPVKRSVSIRSLSSSAPLQPGHRAAPDQGNTEPVQESQKSPSTSSPTAATGLACMGAAGTKCSCMAWLPEALGCCWESALTVRAGSCPGRVGQGCRSRAGEPPGLPSLCRAQHCGLPSCSSWAGSTPCLQHRLEHPQPGPHLLRQAQLGSSTAQQAAARVSPHSPQQESTPSYCSPAPKTMLAATSLSLLSSFSFSSRVLLHTTSSVVDSEVRPRKGK